MIRQRFHPIARSEYVDAVGYHETERVGYGAKFEDEVDAALEQMRLFPGSRPKLEGYPQGSTLRAFPLRSFPYWLIVAQQGDEQIIYAVAHQHRDPGYWADRIP